VQLDNKELKM